MQIPERDGLMSAIAALEGQRATLGDAVLELALAPLRTRLAALQRPSSLQLRQVTVLFADVVGSTAMARSLDAEDTLAVLGDALARMRSVIEAHGGRVLRFTGDGVKAAFGMDEAREDDPVRALRAGLAILAAGREQAAVARREQGVADFALRVGVHTGEVALGAGVEADNTAMGAAVNIAARMEQAAPPGGLLVSQDTWSLVRGLFDVDAQPPLQVKGVETPMTTWRVRAERDRATANIERGLQGLPTPMVGRGDELQRLLHATAQARATRQLQAVTLLGDAGLGKSRLLRELQAVLHDVRVMVVRSQPDGQLQPWGLLRHLLATQFGIADADAADVARRKVVHGLAPWFGESGEKQAQLIGQLSGLDFGESAHTRGLDPRELRDHAFAAVRAWLQALAAPGLPLPVLIVEDLHWADDSSLDLLQHLMQQAAELPLALVMSARPGLLARRAGWAQDGSPAEATISLEPLTAADRDALAQALLQHIDTVPPQLTSLIVERAEGNPYYMEELTRRLIDDGVIVTGEARWTVQPDRLNELRLPATLAGLLQARLDALPAAERQAARQASIVGHVFWDDALQALDPNAPLLLPDLQSSGFVKTHAASRFEGTAERQFDHHLLHQATYDTLLKSERRLGHGAAARWLAARTQGRGAEFLAMTGEHAERAGETELAIECFERASEEAKTRFANTAAMTWSRRALALLGDTAPRRRFELLARIERVTSAGGDAAAQDAVQADMAALLEHHPDEAGQARLAMMAAMVADTRGGDMEAAERLARQAFALAERSGAAETAAESQALQGWIQHKRHRVAGTSLVNGHVDVGLAWAARIEAPRNRMKVEAQLLVLRGIVAKTAWQFDEANRAFADTLARGEAMGATRVQANTLASLVQIANVQGRWDDAVALAERMGALGVRSALGFSLMQRGHTACSRGRHAMALDHLHEALALFRSIRDRRFEFFVLSTLGEVHLALDDPQTAAARCAEALSLGRALSMHALDLACIASTKALADIRLGRRDEALADVDRVLESLADVPQELIDDDGITTRWHCSQVLQALNDARAAAWLRGLHDTVRAYVLRVVGESEADGDRLIEEHVKFRAIVAAHRAAIGDAGA